MNQNLSAAVMWLNNGVVPVPAMPKSKVPIRHWRIWQNKIPPMKTVAYWFSDPSYNVALVCGGKRNLTVIDFDNAAEYDRWYGETTKRTDVWSDIAAKTYRVKTSRGMHLYLYTDKPTKSRKLVEQKIDIRGDGNVVIAPPSVHPSGAVYRAVGTIESIYTIDSIDAVFPDVVVDPVRVVDTDLDVFSRALKITDSSLLAKMVKERVTALDFCSQFSMMRRTSTDGRWWMGRCIHPSHEDRHPSFRVDNVANRAVCLSPGCRLHRDVGLDVIDLYMELNRVGFVEAVRDLAQFYMI